MCNKLGEVIHKKETQAQWEGESQKEAGKHSTSEMGMTNWVESAEGVSLYTAR